MRTGMRLNLTCSLLHFLLRIMINRPKKRYKMKKCIQNSSCQDKWREELTQMQRTGKSLSHNSEEMETSYFRCDTKFNKFTKPEVIKYEWIGTKCSWTWEKWTQSDLRNDKTISLSPVMWITFLPGLDLAAARLRSNY